MDVLFYIKEVLQSQKTVGIEGLGTFYKKKSPGKYDSKKHTFLPPSYSIAFTKEVTEIDELAFFISTTENINLDSAKDQIKQFSDSIENELKNQLQTKLDGIGKLIILHKELEFTPNEQEIIDQDFYGFQTVNELDKTPQNVEDQLKIDNIITTEEVKVSKQESISPIITTNDDVDLKAKAIAFADEHIINDNYVEVETPAKQSKILKLIFILLLIVGATTLLYLLKPGIFNRIINKTSTSAKIENSVPVVPSIAKTDTTTLDTIQKTDVDSTEIILDREKPIEQNIITYEVIGSAEKSEKRIELVVNAMKKRGIDAKPIKNEPGKLVKISLGSFTDFYLAKKYKDSLRKKLNNPEIYIHTIKPKK